MAMKWRWPSGPVGAENGVISCDLLVFVDQSAEPITSTNRSDASRLVGNLLSVGRLLIQGAMGPMAVEVIYILGQHLL